MEDKLVLLVGPSGAGKTAIAKELEKEGYNIIRSYTARKPRTKNEWGHTFISDWTENMRFVVSSDGKQIIPIKDIIAYFNDYNKDEHYFATKEQYESRGTSVYVIDPGGARQVQNNVKDIEIVTIFLMADEITRCSRLAKRVGLEPLLATTREDETKKLEIDKRLKKDKDIFKTCKCDYIVDANGQLKEVLELVKTIII